MTTPFERKRAVTQTREFLQDLLNPAVTPRVSQKIREQAFVLLRHYPTEDDMTMAADNEERSATEHVLYHPIFGNKY